MLMRAANAAATLAITFSLSACSSGEEASNLAGDANGSVAPDCPSPRAAQLPAADPALAGVSHKFYKITVVDDATSQPIAGATVKTTSGDTYTSDDNGNVAFYEPGLMGRNIWFSTTREGYTILPDGLGISGTRLRISEGGSGSIKMNQTGTPPAIAAGDMQTRLLARDVPGRAECMALQIVDSLTQRGVPLVNVATANGSHLSDSQGIVAYCDPDHFGPMALQLTSHGYQALEKTVTLAAGESATLELTRNNVAERLYRITGQGTYRDSLLLGFKIPVRNGGLNAGVTGQDSVISTVFKNKVFWIWGDTNSAGYALGNFYTTAGTSELPAQGGLTPDKGVDITYLSNSGGDFVKGVIPDILPQLLSPVWMGALVTVPDKNGAEQLFGTYSKAISDSESAERGLAQYDEISKSFKSVLVYPLTARGVPSGGQVMRLRSGGQDWAQYSNNLRIAAKAEALVDRGAYQVFTGWSDSAATRLDVVNGAVQYRWRNGSSGEEVSQAAVRAEGLAAGQSLEGHLRDVQTGNSIAAAVGTVHWNAHRRRFVQIIQQKFGTSLGGELWYAEADTPMGPWVDARKIITHDDYTFYNPYTHPYLSMDEGRTVYFEATYTSTYSGSKPTPRYNYNQVMYRVDTDDPKLAMPVPVYDLSATLPGQFVRRGAITGSALIAASFLAPDHAAPGTVAVGWDAAAGAANRKLVTGAAVAERLFYAMPVGSAARPTSAVPLHEFEHADGRRAYSVDASWVAAGFVRAARPVAYVWRNPVQVKMPVGDYHELAPSTLQTCKLPGAA